MSEMNKVQQQKVPMSQKIALGFGMLANQMFQVNQKVPSQDCVFFIR